MIIFSNTSQQLYNLKSIQKIQEFGLFKFSTIDNTIVSLSIILFIVITIWIITLMYRSFTQSFKIQGLKNILLFIICSIIAEILSKKLILYILSK